MLSKIRAVATAGLLGALGGAAIGLVLSLLSSLFSAAGRQVSMGVALDLSIMGGLVGSLFAVGLMAYVRVRGGADRRVATMLGFGAGVLVLPIVVVLLDLPASKWGIAYWLAMLWISGCVSAWAGRIVWSVSGVEGGVGDAPSGRPLRGLSPLDEASLREDRVDDRERVRRGDSVTRSPCNDQAPATPVQGGRGRRSSSVRYRGSADH